MTRPLLAGIHHVKIPVTDLARSIAWYADVFGFGVTMEFPDSEDGVVRGVAGDVPGLGDPVLALRVNTLPARATPPGGGLILGLRLARGGRKRPGLVSGAGASAG